MQRHKTPSIVIPYRVRGNTQLFATTDENGKITTRLKVEDIIENEGFILIGINRYNFKTCRHFLELISPEMATEEYLRCVNKVEKPDELLVDSVLEYLKNNVESILRYYYDMLNREVVD